MVFGTVKLLEMGFAEIRAKKGLMFGNGNDMENAVNWIMEHQEDADIDEPIPEADVAAAAAAATTGTAMDVDGGAAGRHASVAFLRGGGGGGAAGAFTMFWWLEVIGNRAERRK